MADRIRTTAVVHETLIGTWPLRFRDHPLPDDALLGSGGLGLDSIDTVEFLLACEERLGGRSTEELLSAGPLHLGDVVDHFSRA